MARKASEVCLQCGAAIVRTGNRQAFCDSKCYLRHYNKIHPDRNRNACPDCGELKARSNKRCRRCDGLQRRGKNPRRPAPTICPYCESSMRVMDWRGRKIVRCQGCGLETTPNDLRRIKLETEIATGIRRYGVAA